MSFINTNIKKWNIEKYVVRITSRYNVVWESNKVTFLGNTIYQIFIKYLSIYLSNIYLKRNRKLSTLARVVKSFSFKSKCFFYKSNYRVTVYRMSTCMDSLMAGYNLCPFSDPWPDAVSCNILSKEPFWGKICYFSPFLSNC